MILLDFSVLTPPEWAGVIAALVFCGVCLGFLAGLLGIGGGMISVPILYHIFESFFDLQYVDMRMAVATSLAVITLTAFRSARLHHALGNVDRAFFRAWAGPLVLGSLLGSVWASAVPTQYLMLLFAGVVAMIGMVMGFGSAPLRPFFALPKGKGVLPLAGSLGGLAALLGLGGAFLAFPLMVMGGVTPRQAAGNSAACGFAVAVPATLVYILTGLQEPALPPFSLGYVNILAFAIIAPLAMVCVPAGVWVSKRCAGWVLQRAFAFVLGVVALKMLWPSLQKIGVSLPIG